MRVFWRNSSVRAALPVALVLLAGLAGGCRALSGPGEPALAVRPYTEEEWMWTRSMKEMYPDWQEPARPPPPRRLSPGDAVVAVAPPAARPVTPRQPAKPAPAPSPSPTPPPASVAAAPAHRPPPPAVGRSQAMNEAMLAWQPVGGASSAPPALEPPRLSAPVAPPPSAVPAPAPAPKALPPPVVDDPAAGRPLPPAEVEAFQVVPESSVPAPAEGGRPAQYTVRKGDTLSAIAKRFYGSEAGVKAIVEANRDRLPNPDQLPAGTTLRLP